ncbi:hypothetical protein [Microbulbifer sp. SAOS-129_SWC]|uniref:hypothetical protein n=1 Tax=Microbulbifer sp. SAOS-129_SWC TaxID=3145235 RepID=UPI0032175EDF
MQALSSPAALGRLLAFVFCASLFFSTVQLQADEKGLGDDFWEKYDDIADWVSLRLQLTQEQEKKVLPILHENFEKKKAMLKSYGFLSGSLPELTHKQKEEIDAKMVEIRAETRIQLAELLSPQQIRELKKIQREYHEEFRRRLDALEKK